jgi:hypothetical protein
MCDVYENSSISVWPFGVQSLALLVVHKSMLTSDCTMLTHHSKHLFLHYAYNCIQAAIRVKPCQADFK